MRLFQICPLLQIEQWMKSHLGFIQTSIYFVMSSSPYIWQQISVEWVCYVTLKTDSIGFFNMRTDSMQWIITLQSKRHKYIIWRIFFALSMKPFRQLEYENNCTNVQQTMFYYCLIFCYPCFTLAVPETMDTNRYNSVWNGS